MAASAFAQETQRFITIAIDSEVLNQERNLKVSLRQNFSEEKTHPAIYSIDIRFWN